MRAQAGRARAAMPFQAEGADGEQGYILLIVIFLCTLIVLSMAIAAPKIKFSIQRDRDIELRHRGMQYARAVKLYYKKFGSYPLTVAQLQTGSNLNTSSGFSSSGGTNNFDPGSTSAFGGAAAPNQQKFLRRLYPDPITGKPQWRLVFFGQIGMGGNTNPNCAQSGSTALSGSLGGSNTSPASDPTVTGSQSGGSNTSPASDPTVTGSQSGSSSADCNSSSGGLGTPAADAGLSNGNNSSFGGGNGGNSSFPGSGGNGSSFSGSGSGGGLSNGSSSGSIFGGSNAPGSTNGQQQGGPIVGVASLSRKESIIEIKGKNHYNDLEFVYDPTQDFGGGLNGTSVGGATTPPGGNFSGTTPPTSGLGSPGAPTAPTPVTPPANPGTTQ